MKNAKGWDLIFRSFDTQPPETVTAERLLFRDLPCAAFWKYAEGSYFEIARLREDGSIIFAKKLDITRSEMKVVLGKFEQEWVRWKAVAHPHKACIPAGGEWEEYSMILRP